MTNLFYRNVTPEEMALKAALDGDIVFFEAIVANVPFDVARIAAFMMRSDRHVGQTFYLVYELVCRGHLLMLRHLVEGYGLSLKIREEYLEALQQERVKEEKRQAEIEEGCRMAEAYVIDDGYWFIRGLTPYCANTLIDYAKAQIAELEKQRRGLRLDKASADAELRKAKRVIKGRSAQKKRLFAYWKRWREYAEKQYDSICIPHAPKFTPPKKTPLYEALKDRSLCREVRKSLLVKLAKNKEHREKIGVCLHYVKERLAAAAS